MIENYREKNLGGNALSKSMGYIRYPTNIHTLPTFADNSLAALHT